MKIPKFFTVIIFITAFALLYVYQQSEIFRLAYVGQKKQVHFADLLDNNSLLRYNIGKSASLVRIGSRVSNGPEFEMPTSYRLVRLTQPLENLSLAQHVYVKESMLSRLFGIKRQAEAKTISP